MKARLFLVVFLGSCLCVWSNAPLANESPCRTNELGRLVARGKQLYELAEFDEASTALNQSLKLNPQNKAARYYLDLVKEAHQHRRQSKRVEGPAIHPSNPPKLANDGQWLGDKPLTVTQTPALYSKSFHLNSKLAMPTMGLVPDNTNEAVVTIYGRRSPGADSPEAVARRGQIGTSEADFRDYGISTFTKSNRSIERQEQIRSWVKGLGVDFSAPGKSIFYNDRKGLLLVRASLEDLAAIQRAIEHLATE